MFDVDVAYTFHLAEHLGKTGASAPQIVDLWLQRRISPTTAGCELINLVLRVRISHSREALGWRYTLLARFSLTTLDMIGVIVVWFRWLARRETS